MERQETVRVCDCCCKEERFANQDYFGGHPLSGWFKVERHGGGTSISDLARRHLWDFCGKDCLVKHFRDNDLQ
jgi:hypothetical protein